MEKVRILSFDPGTANMGYGVIEGNTITKVVELTSHYGVLKTTKADGDIRARVDKLGRKIALLLEALEVHYVVIEDYTEQGVRSGTTYKDMSILIEHMRMVCRAHGFEASIYTNSEWKRIAMGRGGLNKRQIQHFVKHTVKGVEKLGSRAVDTHVWDVVGIGYAKFRQLQGE